MTPLEATVNAVFSDPAGGASVLKLLADREVLDEAYLTRALWPTGVSLEVARQQLRGLAHIGLVCHDGSSWQRAVCREELLRHEAAARGAAAYAYRMRKHPAAEVVLTPPSRPSHLRDALAASGGAWGRLHDTDALFRELAELASSRFVVCSPFIDAAGVTWVDDLFSRTAAGTECILIVREFERATIDHLARTSAFRSRPTRILFYDVLHDDNARKFPRETFHAKIVLSDAHAAYLGSSNMLESSRDRVLEAGAVLRQHLVDPVVTLVGAMIEVSEDMTYLVKPSE